MSNKNEKQKPNVTKINKHLPWMVFVKCKMENIKVWAHSDAKGCPRHPKRTSMEPKGYLLVGLGHP